MKILVTPKQVAKLHDQFEVSGNTVEDRYFDYELNEWDDYAVEEAVRISEQADDDVEVVSVTIGPERSEETIRTVLAKGVDRAIRIWDECLDDIDLLDTRTKADILAAVVESEQPDLVLTGVQAGDDSFAATGVTLAETVEYAWAAVVTDVDLNPTNDQIRVRRELEGGLEEVTDVLLPAVLTIQTGINEPRYASLRGIRQAQKKELTVRSLDDLGLSPEIIDDSHRLTELREPESEGEAVLWEGDPDEAANQLIEFLRNRGMVDA